MSAEPPHRWTIKTTYEVREWLRALRQADPETYRSVNVAVDLLAEIGPGLGRPLVDTLQGSTIKNLKELRPRSGRDVAIRVIFVFDPWSQATRPVTGRAGTGRRSRWLRPRTTSGWLSRGNGGRAHDRVP